MRVDLSGVPPELVDFAAEALISSIQQLAVSEQVDARRRMASMPDISPAQVDAVLRLGQAMHEKQAQQLRELIEFGRDDAAPLMS